MAFRLSTVDLDPSALTDLVRDPSSGGFVSFEGWVRDHHEGRAVSSLSYEAYPALAVKEGERILAEALERFPVRRAACVHRVGDLGIGGLAVWVGVSSDHRHEAFEACEWIIDQVKHRVPVWKKEFFADGSVEWVRCDRCAQGGGDAHEHHDHGGQRGGRHHGHHTTHLATATASSRVEA